MNDLYQLLWQFPGGHVELKSQMNITEHMAGLPVEGPAAVAREIYEWERDTFARYPLPEGATWLFCNEESKYFVLCDPSTYEVVT